MSSPITQAKEIWNRLPVSGRVAVIGAAVGTLALIFALVYYGSQAEYSVLFSDLKPADAQTIVEKLKAANVPYSISGNGSTVSVPSERVAELRLQMAGAGVLSGGHVGFDLFDKTSFGTTDFAQQVNYRRAIEGELAKTLEGMDEVESARVHITPQKESIFTEKTEGAKASVMLRVRQGRELSNERTEAIVSLVSSSVEGLDASNISVMDTQGRLLTSGRGKNGLGDASNFNDQLEARQKFQSETAARIISLLEPITGTGHVRADVSADVDFSQIEQTEEKYNPQSQVVRSQQTSQELRNSPAQNQGGVAGARANNPATAPTPTPQPSPGANANSDQRTTATTNYEIDKTTRKTLGGGGRINRLSVSVVVDHKNVNGVQTARTPEELKQIQDLVAAAVGVDTQRGDNVVVQTMPFDQPQLETPNPTFLERYQKYIPSAIKYGTLVLIALLLLIFVVRPALRAVKAAAAPPPAVVEETKQIAEGTEKPAEEKALEEADDERRDAESELETDLNGIEALREAEEMKKLAPMKTVAELEAEMDMNEEELALAKMDELSPEIQRAITVRKLLAEQTVREPKLVAGTLRSWLHETGSNER